MDIGGGGGVICKEKLSQCFYYFYVAYIAFVFSHKSIAFPDEFYIQLQ